MTILQFNLAAAASDQPILFLPSQGIAEANDAFLIDYSVLYDQIVRATLWVEVGLSVCLSLSRAVCHVSDLHLPSLLPRTLHAPSGPPVPPMVSQWTTQFGSCTYRDGETPATVTMETYTGLSALQYIQHTSCGSFTVMYCVHQPTVDFLWVVYSDVLCTLAHCRLPVGCLQ